LGRDSVRVVMDHVPPVLLHGEMRGLRLPVDNGERCAEMVQNAAMLNRHFVVVRDENRWLKRAYQVEQRRVCHRLVAQLVR